MVSPLVRLFILSQQHSNRGDTKLQPANEHMAPFFNDYMYREKLIKEIAVAMSVLENANTQDLEDVKIFLRRMSDDDLMDMHEKHKKLLEQVVTKPA